MFRPGLRAFQTPFRSVRQHGQFRAYQQRRFGNPRPQYRRFDAPGMFMRWAARPTFYRDVGLISLGAGGFYIYNLEEVPVCEHHVAENPGAGLGANHLLGVWSPPLQHHQPLARRIHRKINRRASQTGIPKPVPSRIRSPREAGQEGSSETVAVRAELRPTGYGVGSPCHRQSGAECVCGTRVHCFRKVRMPG
jgi:hypothetical protein